MCLRERSKLVHLRRIAAEVNGHDGAGARGDGSGHCRRIEAERVGVNVRKDHVRSHEQGRKGCGHEREGRHDHFVARPNVERAQADIQARCAARERNAKRGVVVVAKACI